MSDTADDIGFNGRQLLNKAKTDPLRRRMRAFVVKHEDRELKQLREAGRDGEDLSTVVRESRDERLWSDGGLLSRHVCTRQAVLS